MNKRWIAAVSLAGLLAAVAAPMTVPAYAAKTNATGVPKPGKGEKGSFKGLTRVKNALGKLNLTPQQKPRVDDAVKAAEAELKKLQTGGDAKANKKQAKNVIAGLRNKLSSILTPEQQKQLQSLTMKKNKKPAI